MVEALFCVVYFIGMFVYYSLWLTLIDRHSEHGDALPLTLQMMTWPLAYFWLCYTFNKGDLK